MLSVCDHNIQQQAIKQALPWCMATLSRERNSQVALWPAIDQTLSHGSLVVWDSLQSLQRITTDTIKDVLRQPA